MKIHDLDQKNMQNKVLTSIKDMIAPTSYGQESIKYVMSDTLKVVTV